MLSISNEKLMKLVTMANANAAAATALSSALCAIIAEQPKDNATIPTLRKVKKVVSVKVKKQQRKTKRKDKAAKDEAQEPKTDDKK